MGQRKKIAWGPGVFGKKTAPRRKKASPGSKRVDWGAVPLGEKTDREIAEELGVNLSKVQRARKARNIPSFAERRRNEALQAVGELLGKAPDSEIARAVGMSKAWVRAWRTRLGVKPYRLPSETPAAAGWNAQPLGKISDVELARKLGVSHQAVAYQRARRGIPAWSPPNQIDWDAQPLGEMPDRELAEKLGARPKTVANNRRARGIEACPRKQDRPDIDWDLLPLGEVPDTQIAEQVGVVSHTVAYHRRKRGIEAFTKRK